MGSFTTAPPNTSSAGALPLLPYEQRHLPVQYRAADGNVGEEAYPINYNELYHLKGRLLTLIDATFQDPEQRKAMKDMVWHTLRSWLDDIAGGTNEAAAVGLKAAESRSENAA